MIKVGYTFKVLFYKIYYYLVRENINEMTCICFIFLKVYETRQITKNLASFLTNH